MLETDNKIKELEKLFLSDYKFLKEGKINFEVIQNKYLGRKGLLNTLYPLLSKLEGEKKSDFGKKINNFKKEILSNLDKSKPKDSQEKKQNINIDLTLPESYQSLGSIHPITIIIDEIKDIFSKIGYTFDSKIVNWRLSNYYVRIMLNADMYRNKNELRRR